MGKKKLLIEVGGRSGDVRAPSSWMHLVLRSVALWRVEQELCERALKAEKSKLAENSIDVSTILKTNQCG